MYNRYIPQPDGTFRRSQVQDNSYIPPAPKPRPEPEAYPPEPTAEYDPPPQKVEPHREQPQRTPPSCRRMNQRPQPYAPPRQNRQPPRTEHVDEAKSGSVGNFLRQLLPKDFDTNDLLIVLLLLLMSGDCQEDQNSALLTLVLYLFM